jgi:hypothetical protein
MLKNRVTDADLTLSTIVYSEDYSSDRDFYNSKLLNLTTNGVVNGVIDSEIYEYKPEQISEINLNIFFLRYIQNNEYTELRKYVESGLDTQYNKTKITMGLINSQGVTITKAFNNVFETRQSNGLRETPVLAERTLTKLQELIQKPYYVRDKVGESFLKKPIKSGLPVYYNTFAFPFWDAKDKWVKEPLLFSNKPYFYNSFLLLEFYDSPLTVTQNRIQSIPVFVNSRYNITEKNITNNFHYERPCFKLTDGVDGFSFFFLNNYITNEFYVKYSFWDALNGKKIQLLPSSNLDVNKKWIQDPNEFDQNLRYVKYVVNYETKTYKMFEYNPITKAYDTERANYDLYELEFDPYYKRRVVFNDKPIDSKTSVVTTELVNPLSFTIKNLYTNNFVGSGASGKLPRLTESSNSTFLGITNDFLLSFDAYLANLPTKTFGVLTNTELKIPVVDRTINGHRILLKSFNVKNADTKTWNIRSLEFKDITVSIDGVTINNNVYNQRQSLWNESPSYRVAESITLLNKSNQVYDINQGDYQFTKDVLTTYMSDSTVFKKLLESIEYERLSYAQSYSEQSIPAFLDKCFSTLKVAYVFGHKKTPRYDEYSFNPTTRLTNYDHSEIYYYIDKLVEGYIKLKSENQTAFNDIRNSAVALLESYMNNRKDVYSICSNVVTAINAIITPKDNPELISKYIPLVSQKSLNAADRDAITTKLTQNSVSLNLDKPVSELGYEIRDYALLTVAIQNGDKFMIKGETNKIDVYFNIGKKLNFLFVGATEVVIRGRLRLSIIDNNGEIKNIAIPMKSVIKPKTDGVKPTSSNLPKYTVSTPEIGSKINQLKLIK